MASTTAAPRRFYSLASSVLVATVLATLSVGACSNNDNANATDASGDETIKLLCDTFNGSGKPCSPVSTQVCFAMCAKGGCRCVAGPSGGVWQCSTDESCFPGGPDFEGGSDDGSTGMIDASNSTDGATDGATDASGDAFFSDAFSDAGD